LKANASASVSCLGGDAILVAGVIASNDTAMIPVRGNDEIASGKLTVCYGKWSFINI